MRPILYILNEKKKITEKDTKSKSKTTVGFNHNQKKKSII